MQQAREPLGTEAGDGVFDPVGAAQALDVCRAVRPDELRPEFGGDLPIAASFSICTYLPEVRKSYPTTNPEVVVSVRSGNSEQVLKWFCRARWSSALRARSTIRRPKPSACGTIRGCSWATRGIRP